MFERLEDRHLLSAGGALAGNAFAEFVGMLSTAEKTEHIEVSIAPAELSLARDKAILGFRLKAVEGSSFDPAELLIRNETGAATVLYDRSDLPGMSDSLVIAELTGGGYTLDVSGGLETRSQFRLEVFLVGDVDGDHAVDRGDLNRIRFSYGAVAGDGRYLATADANLDGRITAFDLAIARRNEQYGRPAAGEASAASSQYIPTPVSRSDQSRQQLIGPVAMTATAKVASAEAMLRATTPPPGTVYDRVAAVVPAEGYEADAPMQFFESTKGWVQPLASRGGPQGGVWTAPGEEGAQSVIIVDWFYREAGYGNDLSLYTVDNDNGDIGEISPGDDGYRIAALCRVQGTLNSLNCASMANPNHQYDVPDASPLFVQLDAGTKFSFFVTQGTYEDTQGEYYQWFPFSSANVDNYQHFQQVTTGDSGAGWYNQWIQDLYAYKVEDLSNDTENYPNPCDFDNDADFNDVVFHVVPLALDLDISNGGSDLDNGEATGQDGSMVADNEEESLGAYLLVNWDDDDGDGQMNDNGSFSQLPVPDLTETSVQNEDNLAKLVPSLDPALTTGVVELEVTSGSSRIKLWTQKTKGTEITLTGSKKTWDLSNSSQRSDFQSCCTNGIWIEGIETSTAERDVTFVLRYKYGGQEVTSDTVKATVVMINLGNAVYRDNMLDIWGVGQNDRGHAALVARFTGPCTRDNLLDDTRFTIIEMDGPTDNRTLDTITDEEGYPCYGCFTNPSVSYVDRLRILTVAKWLVAHANTIDYTAANALLSSDQEHPERWNGDLNTIGSLRCDGLVEVCYEINGIEVWAMFRDADDGGDDTYNYNIADQTDDWDYNPVLGTWDDESNDEPDNLEEHNDFDSVGWADTLMPATQCGHVTPEDAATTFEEQDLCTPVGSTGGN